MFLKHLPIAGLFWLTACGGSESPDPFLAPLQQPPYLEWTEKIERSPQNDSLYFGRGMLLLQNDQLAAARLDLEKAWSIQPNPQYALALSSLLENDPPKQAAHLQKSLMQLPENFLLEWALAETLLRMDSSDAALNITGKWIAKGALEPEFVLLHAQALKQKDRTDEAMQFMEKLHEVSPAYREATEILALWYAESGNEKIIGLTEKMVKADSLKRNPLPHYFMGIYFDTKKQYERSISAFDKAIQTDYHFTEAYIEKAALLYEQRKFTNALQTLEKALAVAPDEAAVYYWTAKCQQAQGDMESARMNYLKAYGLDKSFTQAKQAAEQLK